MSPKVIGILVALVVLLSVSSAVAFHLKTRPLKPPGTPVFTGGPIRTRTPAMRVLKNDFHFPELLLDSHYIWFKRNMDQIGNLEDVQGEGTVNDYYGFVKNVSLFSKKVRITFFADNVGELYLLDRSKKRITANPLVSALSVVSGNLEIPSGGAFIQVRAWNLSKDPNPAGLAVMVQDEDGKVLLRSDSYWNYVPAE